MTMLWIDQRPVELGRRIGKGGEGEVFALKEDGQHAVKLYADPTADREAKIAAMIRAGLAAKAPQVAFPLGMARTQTGSFAGFLMKLVADHRPLHELYSPGSRRLHFPHVDYRFLVRSALNIARVSAAVHDLGCVIGDINHSSILIARNATVSLIDSDSFQIQQDGRIFRCKVGVPEYTPPELQGMTLAEISRTPNHDAFGLAVALFQLLFMGRQPFVGRVRQGEIPELADAVREHRFAYSEQRDVGMDRPPGTPALRDFPREVAEGFEQAFGPGHMRPSAGRWIELLEGLEKGLVQCPEHAVHWYPGSARSCLWCAMEKVVATTLFVPYIPPAQTTVAEFDPGAGGFDLGAVWAPIEALIRDEQLDPLVLSPVLPPLTMRPRPEVRAARVRAWVKRGAYLLLLGLLVLRPGYFLWYLLAAGVVRFFTGPNVTPFLAALHEEARSRLDVALRQWRAKVGAGELEKEVARLRKAAKDYENLPEEERRRKAAYRRNRRARQLNAYLATFEIRNYRIKGIGRAKLASLTSFGIETAADVEESRVLGVPGMGPVNSQGLFDWRKEREAGFVYDEKPNEEDQRELAQIQAAIQEKGSTLRRTLLAGRGNLEALLKRTRALAALKDAELFRAYALCEQARVDVNALGGRVPPWSAAP